MSIRESMRDYTPARFADVLPELASFGWRTLWSIAMAADAAADWAIEGVRAKLPGIGTPTALPVIARDREIVRGRVESESDHVARLVRWIDLHRDRGKMRGMTREIQNYLGRTNGGQWHHVACVSRRGTWGIRRENGEYEYLDPGEEESIPWNWDGVSHPERAGLWSDMWIIVRGVPYEHHIAWWWPSDESSLGHDAPQHEVATIRELVVKWKAARTRVRAIIWSPNVVPDGDINAGLVCFEPTTGGTFMPDGTWGSWAKIVGGASVPARPNWLRFWEF